MSSPKARIEAALRHFEQRIGIDREGRTVWVWLVPLAVGLVAGVLAAFMPGLPDETPWAARLGMSIFALVTMTGIASIYLISFDNDHNQEARAEDSPGQGGDGGSKVPSPTPGSPPPQWLSELKPVARDEQPAATRRERRPRIPTGASR